MNFGQNAILYAVAYRFWKKMSAWCAFVSLNIVMIVALLSSLAFALYVVANVFSDANADGGWLQITRPLNGIHVFVINPLPTYKGLLLPSYWFGLYSSDQKTFSVYPANLAHSLMYNKVGHVKKHIAKFPFI